MNYSGTDSEGQGNYETPQELWKLVEQDPAGKENAWYNKAVEYWDKQEATYDGVLGGYGHVSGVDIQESERLLKRAFAAQLGEAAEGSRQLVALDCGAGVGRVSEQLLLRYFHEVDLIEPSAHLLNTARQKLTGAGQKPFPSTHRAVNFFQTGLQNFEAAHHRYDVVWIQWSLLYLTDDDALAFFERMKSGLKPDGLFIIKENICKEGFIVDKEDMSLTRSNTYMLDLLRRAGLTVVYNVQQRNFPKELFQVRMYAVRPSHSTPQSTPSLD